jgi:hypothetical protein
MAARLAGLGLDDGTSATARTGMRRAVVA